MKIKNKLIKNKLIKLKLIETKIYSNTYKKNPLKIDDIVANLKKALNIIYKYHTNNKKILFIGSNKNNNNFKKLLINTKHTLLPKFIWMNGIITNTNLCFKYFFKNHKTINNKFYTTLIKLNKQIDLIVILDSYYPNKILKESYLAKIPIILLDNGNNKSVTDIKASYTIPGNFNFLKKKMRVNLIYLILSALFRKVNTINQKISNNDSLELIKIKN